MVERTVRVTTCNWKIKRKREIVVCHGPVTLQSEWIQINFTRYLLVSRPFQLKWSVDQLDTSNFIVVRKAIQDALHKYIFCMRCCGSYYTQENNCSLKQIDIWESFRAAMYPHVESESIKMSSLMFWRLQSLTEAELYCFKLYKNFGEK